MSGRPRKIPSYTRHKASGQAVVRINNQDFYLGGYGTPVSYEKYHRLVAEHFPNGPEHGGETSSITPLLRPNGDLSVMELVAAYWLHAKEYYVKNGNPTSEQASLRLAFRPLLELYGHAECRNFGPLALAAVRNKMIETRITRKRINQHVGRIRRMFKWGVSREMLPADVFQALATLEGLRKGRTKAKESQPVKPVSEEHVQAVLPFLQPQVRDMVRLQRKIGCRPQEVILIRPCDVDRSQDPWIYTPSSHKCEHLELERKIPIGSEGQKILFPWLDRAPGSYCFSPRESREAYFDERRRNRKTPHTPSSRNRQRMVNPKRKPRERYTTSGYDYAVARACKKAKVPHWHPNQLRHTVATEVRSKYGLEGSQVVLGHSTANITQVYAERDFEFAKQIMKEIG
jgi:integrase